MDCDRLQNLIRSWYLQVQDEALAPARMVFFIKKHIAECSICRTDPILKKEVDKIIAFVLPPAKAPKEKESDATPDEDGEIEDVSTDKGGSADEDYENEEVESEETE